MPMYTGQEILFVVIRGIYSSKSWKIHSRSKCDRLENSGWNSTGLKTSTSKCRTIIVLGEPKSFRGAFSAKNGLLQMKYLLELPKLL